MSIIRATRQKGGYSSDHKATSYGEVTDEPAFKPKGKQEQQQLISWKNQRYQERIFNHTGKFLLAVFFMLLDRIFRNPQTAGNFRNLQPFQCKLHYETTLGRKLLNRRHQIGRCRIQQFTLIPVAHLLLSKITDTPVFQGTVKEIFNLISTDKAVGRFQ